MAGICKASTTRMSDDESIYSVSVTNDSKRA